MAQAQALAIEVTVAVAAEATPAVQVPIGVTVERVVPVMLDSKYFELGLAVVDLTVTLTQYRNLLSQANFLLQLNKQY